MGWEVRFFWNKNPNISIEITKDILFKNLNSFVKNLKSKPEKRTDLYLNFDLNNIGMKFRTKRNLEMKKRTKIITQDGINCESWQKIYLNNKKIDQNNINLQKLFQILENCIDKEDYNQAKSFMESKEKVEIVSVQKNRWQTSVSKKEIQNMTSTQLRNFEKIGNIVSMEFTEVNLEYDEKKAEYYSVCIEGGNPSTLCTIGDALWSYLEKNLEKDQKIFQMGYPEFIAFYLKNIQFDEKANQENNSENLQK
ncbi:hypothetical protein M0811_05234 [Anaeramoeba ignava]|uniref:Uncharacterized protein n=1 Tax=Anaeramoeba ignava TaxID=1746090 RepID=A0A9Q0LS47_ANAIG|nr:hypothetical protein M0811_05234 [Anaeramoeba ignava]